MNNDVWACRERKVTFNCVTQPNGQCITFLTHDKGEFTEFTDIIMSDKDRPLVAYRFHQTFDVVYCISDIGNINLYININWLLSLQVRGLKCN